VQRQELRVKGARGDAKELAELPIPVRYRWVPEGLAPDSQYNVAQLYARLAEGIRDGKPISPGFAVSTRGYGGLDLYQRAKSASLGTCESVDTPTGSDRQQIVERYVHRCLVTDGGGTLILVVAERACDFPQKTGFTWHCNSRNG
jgi:hypothetical protein